MATGLATSLASRGIREIIGLSIRRAHRWRFAQVFGQDAIAGNLWLVPDTLVPPTRYDAKGNLSPFVFTKSGNPNTAFATSLAVPFSALRASKYIADCIAANAGRWSRLSSDEALRHTQDLSFVSFGLTSNLKTLELLDNSANHLVSFKDGAFVSRQTGKALIRGSADTDFGLVLKVNPSHLADRVWICCAGMGEWGTSGAAWFLSRNWKMLRSEFGKGPFAVIVRVRPPVDESADVVVKATTATELERYSRE